MRTVKIPSVLVCRGIVLLLFSLVVPILSGQTGQFPPLRPGGGGVGVPPATAEAAGPVNFLDLDLTLLGLDTPAKLAALTVSCYTGTGFSSGHITGTRTPEPSTLSNITNTSVRATLSGSKSNALCIGQAGGSPGAAGANGATGATGPSGSNGTNGSNGSVGPVAWRLPVPWLSSDTYSAGPPSHVVTYQGQSFVAIATSTNVAPPGDGSKWVQITTTPGRTYTTVFSCVTTPCTLAIHHSLNSLNATLRMVGSDAVTIEANYRNMFCATPETCSLDADWITVDFPKPHSGTLWVTAVP